MLGPGNITEKDQALFFFKVAGQSPTGWECTQVKGLLEVEGIPPIVICRGKEISIAARMIR
jgi:hypothetical protein